MDKAGDPVFRFHKNLMNIEEINALSRMLKPLIAKQKCTIINLDEWSKKKTQSKGIVTKHDYPDWFEDLWGKLPNKTGKPQTLKECEKAFKRGYTIDDILKGVPGYVAEEKRRSKKEDYQKHHPQYWIKDDRFLDDPGTDLSQPKKKPLDVAADIIGKKIGLLVQGHSKVVLAGLLADGLTRDQIMNEMNKYEKGENLSNFFYKVEEIINGGS